MKKIVGLIAVLLLTGSLAAAQDAAVTPPPAADTFLGSLWSDVRTNSSFHLLDNAAPVWGQDIVHGQQLIGVTTSVYMYRFISMDVQAWRKSDTDANVFPGAGPNIHADLLVKELLPGVYDSVSGLLPEKFDKTTLCGGVSFSRDFYDHVWRTTLYAGFNFRFGK